MNILTCDIEDWFHLLDIPATANVENWDNFTSRIHGNVDRLLEIIQLHGHSATFFCLGWVAEKYPEVIRKIDASGFEIATHTHTHQLVYQQKPEQFCQDIRRSICTLEDITGKKVKSFRAPGFSIIPGMPWAFETLVELGIERDSSIFPLARGHGGFATFGSARPAIIECGGGTLKEFPISLGRLWGKQIVFSGGGYYRLLPYRTVQKLTTKSDYLMSYFHPRDFDPEQPVLDLPLFRRFKSYVGLQRAFTKFDRWLAENEFIDMLVADEAIDWDSVPRISVN
ncbi:polysaccharide deacetylase family protein [Geothermobacter hydrogeniphilus]|uniref:Polysaccharide deacetylase n=1 Tax=Geothermobacter hydrogeniphilus TaxID=1969733 RepID=A0A1X0Y0Y4_9BACT|nr:polysaccharide deacetylase family protein [Geothermobacter hydrogeniphilus]ORJ58769.1 polysaccharide deacetylase [Geothermobacter hydrogeniphilus]